MSSYNDIPIETRYKVLLTIEKTIADDPMHATRSILATAVCKATGLSWKSSGMMVTALTAQHVIEETKGQFRFYNCVYKKGARWHKYFLDVKALYEHETGVSNDA